MLKYLGQNYVLLLFCLFLPVSTNLFFLHRLSFHERGHVYLEPDDTGSQRANNARCFFFLYYWGYIKPPILIILSIYLKCLRNKGMSITLETVKPLYSLNKFYNVWVT